MSYNASTNINQTTTYSSSTSCYRNSTYSSCRSATTYSYQRTLYGYNVSTNDYLAIVYGIWTNDYRLLDRNISKLLVFALPIYRSDLRDQYSKPMLWIGMYIAFASLLCILAMLADLLHGLRNKKFWIPSNYFKLNATFLLLISIAMKLPVDLSGSMPGDVDQAAKLGSIAFMCTMMANLLPSLAAMDNKELLANITALGILVITLAVNVCIQINTGVVSVNERDQLREKLPSDSKYLLYKLETLGVSNTSNKHRNSRIATVYVTILLVLLIIHVCSSLAILKSKKIIESEYQKRHKKATKDMQQSPGGRPLCVKKLEEHLQKYWIMAGSGSPQFIVACSVAATASGVLCVVPAFLQIVTMCWEAILKKDWGSDYKWSILVILIVQFIGVIVGTIAPFLRCFATLSFKVSIKSIYNHIKVFKVESYWSSMLSEWKKDSTPFRFRGGKLEAVIHYSRSIIISFCIQLQAGVVVICKTIALVPFFVMIFVLYCFRSLKKLWRCMFQQCVEKPEKSEQNKDLGEYVLHLEDENELAERTLDGLLKSMNRLIRKGEKREPKNLMKLIKKKSKRDFPGVEDFEDRSLPSKKHQDCWSLPVVTLTTIAVSLPGIGKEEVDSLWRSVREGLKYVTLVEDTLNATDDYASVRKAAETLWQEVNFHGKWLGKELEEPGSTNSHQVYKTRRVIEWFKDEAEKKESPADTQVPSTHESICANSMYRITQSIMLSYQQTNDINDDDKVMSQRQVFDKLLTMIADIIAACLTNLPQVIITKCDTTIEKREANVRSAAHLLGESKEIIMIVQELQPSNMETNDMPFIGKWRDHRESRIP